jgi:hypothetical protein
MPSDGFFTRSIQFVQRKPTVHTVVLNRTIRIRENQRRWMVTLIPQAL